MTFGIPSATLAEGYKPMRAWVEGQIQEAVQHPAARTSRDEPVVTPALASQGITEHDVLFGKSGGAVDHVGTVRFRKRIDELMPVYETSSRHEKTEIADNLIAEVRASEGRLMKYVATNGGIWEEVSHALARQKTAHTFRNRRRNFADST